MLPYCSGNETFLPAWQYHGFSPCFLETVGPSIFCALMLVFGSIQLRIYRKHGTTLAERVKPRSWLFHLQLLFLVLMPLIILFRLAVQITVLQNHKPAGSMIVYCIAYIIALGVSVSLVFMERNYMLPTIPTRGHGLVILGFWALVLIFETLSFVSFKSPWWWWKLQTYDDRVELGLFITRYIFTVSLFFLGILAPGLPSNRTLSTWLHEEPKPEDAEGSAGTGSRTGFRQHEKSTFKNLYGKMKVLMPFVWPRRDLRVQLCVFGSIVLLVAGRGVNLLTPIYYKRIVDSLTNPVSFRYDLILIFVFVRFLQGGGTGAMGFLNNLRSYLWIPVQQYTTREIEVSLFGHLHSLSLRWHLSRKTGEVLRVMDRGTDSVNNLLNYVVFQILPTVADIIIAIVYFVSAFNAWFGLIVFVTMALYLAGTIWLTEWRTKYRRTSNLLENESRQKAMDSLINFETVKYYNAEEYEVGRYREAIVNFQKMEWASNASLCILNFFQNVTINLGFLAGSLLCAWMVYKKDSLNVGDFVLLGTYIIQLYGPLNWFGTYYRMIQTAFVDMENMFDLLNEKEEVKDLPGAPMLNTVGGEIEFRDVYFAYEPARPILKGISFKVPAGKTVALVGHTGSGKSTVIRLMFRFYDVQRGAILFDGQDISKVKQKTLRYAIGVVPQDTVLFNAPIRYNIRYGRNTAEDEEVEEAARAAEIHDRILSFPDKYDTVVGERGLKLSGGEKQRVAIARTILKSPMVVLLDEATSALDTQTERQIQSSLARICANRTTIIVAHRLSTIIHADQILVLQEGEIVERGSHDELLKYDGKYRAMWEEQLKARSLDESPGSSAEPGTSGALVTVDLSDSHSANA
ncbi:ATP-binding cassette sub-family B member 6-like isoform X2 [Paramacrobiotus metropolitanus]|uniref:ATP-binding cassette sub-family B member 6-like isoform X2 n=1 Tax=Paramacrobiotus metropolitanus TaxID=2943436 RepID=UPI002445650D|nr:ATP-binding cassette sub-family B member 6-like isoform X2 [Paramacrobiotus metropolitanus]